MFEKRINKINKYLSEQLWMDFEVCIINRGKVEFFGFLDEAAETQIRITFEQPYMMQSALVFTFEGGDSFISILSGTEAFVINKQYNVTQGNYIFKLSNTNIETDMFIIAKDIDVEIMNG